ncbi:amidohydrolase [Burkholderia sp. L27(2015)]|uniref:amidohydrolase family protein n=1 Tax=Burkholderia sp. L27(2015) TaxID=1641858 RepID=UPI00131D02ED|nr:amidohydrolase family protein [Burkholderia sp. L27(2015)]
MKTVTLSIDQATNMNDISSNGIDCHIHLFGDALRYPAIAERSYTPTEATLSQWRAISEPLGVRRAVLVQPSAYGTDNARLLHGLRKAGDMVRGIAVIDDATPDHVLETMHALGVRGVRLNFVTGVSPDPHRVPAQLQAIAARIADLGWHLQVLARGALLESIAAHVPHLGVPVVFDHMAGARTSLGLDEPGFKAALGLLRKGKCWIKISGADHVSAHREAPEEALTIMRSLIEANSDQLIWGSDWPHIGKAGGPQSVEYLPIDHGRLLALLRQASGEAYKKILTDNPARLYGWT